jgi:xanthine dehydrogenase YagT iron-sulfur-binding subunit
VVHGQFWFANLFCEAIVHKKADSKNAGSDDTLDVSRRSFMQSAAWAVTVTAAPAALSGQLHQVPPGEHTEHAPVVVPPQPVTLTINGKRYQLSIEPRTTMLDALREIIGLTGTKKGCDRGQCGACTVLIDGQRVNACLTLAIMQEGKQIETIEGLAQGENLHPLQAAFIDHDALQCGYCTPGQICSAKAMLGEVGRGCASAVTPDVRTVSIALSDAEIRERMSGNICRCGAYQNIVAAIRQVAGSKT